MKLARGALGRSFGVRMGFKDQVKSDSSDEVRSPEGEWYPRRFWGPFDPYRKGY